MKAAAAAVVRQRANLAKIKLTSCIQFGIYARLPHYPYSKPMSGLYTNQGLPLGFSVCHQSLRGFAGSHPQKLTHEKKLSPPQPIVRRWFIASDQYRIN